MLHVNRNEQSLFYVILSVDSTKFVVLVIVNNLSKQCRWWPEEKNHERCDKLQTTELLKRPKGAVQSSSGDETASEYQGRTIDKLCLGDDTPPSSDTLFEI